MSIGPQPPTNAPKTPNAQLVVSQASLLNSTPLNHGTPSQDSEATSLLYARTTLRADIEMLLMSRVHVWKIVIIDERVHTRYYDRQGGIQSHGLDIISNLPHFFILLALQRLDMEGWRFAPNLSFDTDNHSPAQLEVTLQRPAVNLEAPIQQFVVIVKLLHDQVLQVRWGLVGRAMTVYECDLADYPLKEQVFKLSWPEVSRTPEPDDLQALGEIADEGAKDHILTLLASEMPTMMDTCLIRKRLGTLLLPHFSEPRASRRLEIPVYQKRCPVWDLTADELFNVWMQTLSRHITLWGNGFHHRDISPENMITTAKEAMSLVSSMNGPQHRSTMPPSFDRPTTPSIALALNDWDLATVLSFSATPKTERTGTIPFMALQRLAGKRVVHISRHDGESFFWLFLWVCGCSGGSKREVPVAPYNGWRKRDLLACKIARGAFLSRVNLEDINVSEHHAANALFCLFLAKLLQQLRAEMWNGIPTSMNHSAKEKKDMALFQALLPKFREVRAELNRRFSPKDWFDDDDELRPEVGRYIRTTVAAIIDGDFS